MSSPSAHPPHALGAWGEAQAARALEEAGFRILERNYRAGRREVDLVVRRGRVLAFVEVKTRSGVGFGSPEEAVTGPKRGEIERVAREYLVRHPMPDVDVRFDVVAIEVGPGRRIVRLAHLADAWRPTGSHGQRLSR